MSICSDHVLSWHIPFLEDHLNHYILLEYIAQKDRDIYLFGDRQNLTVHNPQQSAVTGPVLGRMLEYMMSGSPFRNSYIVSVTDSIIVSIPKEILS